MKKLALTFAFTALSGAAFAADLPSRQPAPSPIFAAPAFSWTGFYAGFNAGYADPTAKFSVVPGGSWIGDPDVPFTSATSPGIVNAGSRNLALHGFTGGLQFGYNYQINNFVLGIEADANYLSLQKSYATPVYNGVAGGTYSGRGSANIDAFYTFRGRLGYASDRWLFFVTGGIAAVSQNFSQSIDFLNVQAPPQIPRLPFTTAAGGANAGRASTTAVSWTLGGGLEYAFNNQWSAKAEYLYVHLKPMNFSSVYGPVPGVEPGTWRLQHRLGLTGLNVFRFGVNYHFGT